MLSISLLNPWNPETLLSAFITRIMDRLFLFITAAIVLQIVDFVEDKCGMSEDEHPRVRPKPELRKLPAKTA
jgi:hypothetical protein